MGGEIMSVPVYVNGRDLYETYKARLLGYTVGSPAIGNAYLSQSNSIIPIKLKETIGTRPVELKLEFSGDNCHESLLNISNMTAELLDETELLLPDGFYYHCILDQVSTPSLEGDTFYSVTFTMAGYRHGPMESKQFTETGAIDVKGNCKAPAIITIENAASSSVTVNDITVKDIAATVIINGFDKTVFETDGVVTSNKYKSCDMTRFPSLDPGVNMINISGAARITIEYQPIYL
jgi:phage-related protein